ncbi:hypothetical protein SteCoe_36721 [Stentor coeruleus]|uniref:Protein kinase domain-containing protein n=1 Tax=Stentor coeruleus TaxID=5963 RepID=A0A1R2APJ2_9CILI|nr:hypothetical protein SteCoe_36721 [Stentor coeruleus]
MSSTPKIWKIEDFTLGRILGRGANGSVYHATHKESKKEFAIKVISRTSISKHTVKYIRREIEFHSRIRHPNIIRLYGYFYNEKNLYILLEYMGGGDLHSYIKRNSPINQITAKNILYSIAKALEYLSTLKIIHRDLKPENVLISNNLDVKIADFGLCALEPPKEKRYSCVGTLQFMSPEMAGLNGYDCSNDLWDLGLIMYEVLCGEAIVYITNINQIITLEGFEPPNNWNEHEKDLFRKLTSRKNRISVFDVAKHPFFV